ncbi:unnamed protein product [Boreogadus saida]
MYPRVHTTERVSRSSGIDANAEAAKPKEPKEKGKGASLKKVMKGIEKGTSVTTDVVDFAGNIMDLMNC